MKILVLGGSGLIGNAVVRAMSMRGHDVTTLSRGTSKSANLEGLTVKIVTGDLDDPHCLDNYVSGNDVVVDAAGPYALQPLTEPGSPIVRAEQRIVSLLQHVKRANAALVHIGSMSVERPPPPTIFHAARSRFARAAQPYFAVKELMERKVEEARCEGTPALILKPTACFGPWDMKPKELCWLPALLDGELPVTLEHRLNVVDTRDLADLIAAKVEQAEFSGKVPVTGHNTTVGELFELACRLTGIDKPDWSVPAELAILPSLWTEWVLAMAGRPTRLPALVAMLLAEQDWVTGDAARESFVSLRPLINTVRDAIDWYRSIGYIRDVRGAVHGPSA